VSVPQRSAGPSPLRYRRDALDRQGRLWDRCVFVDWHGVLCEQPFWHSITENHLHQLRVTVADAVASLFGERRELVIDWMRGEIDSARVVDTLPDPSDGRCRPDFLYRRLHEDCAAMVIRIELVEALGNLPELTAVAIATDNMDCFSEMLPSIGGLAGTFHAALCSSDLGVLKAEDPEAFFGPWLAEQGLSACDAVLVDDAEANCARFEQFGGHAIRFHDAAQAARELHRWLST
jgi:FMN phosphatase YigB (HAD superfamily)